MDPTDAFRAEVIKRLTQVEEGTVPDEQPAFVIPDAEAPPDFPRPEPAVEPVTESSSEDIAGGTDLRTLLMETLADRAANDPGPDTVNDELRQRVIDESQIDLIGELNM